MLPGPNGEPRLEPGALASGPVEALGRTEEGFKGVAKSTVHMGTGCQGPDWRGGFTEEVGKACGWGGGVPGRLPVVKTLPACEPVWLRPGPCRQSGEAALVVLTVPGRAHSSRGCSSRHTLAAEGPAGAECGNPEQR